MADYNSSLPVRTQNNGDVVAFLADGTTNTQLLAIDASGRVTANQGAAGASNWLATTPYTGTSAPGTAATGAALIAGEYNSALPTLTTGQQAAIQVDSNGRILVNIAASAGAINVTQGTTPWITSDLADGAVANGAAGTKSILGGLIYLAAAPTLTTGNQNSLLGDVAGNLLVNLKTALPAGANVIGAVTQSGTWTVQPGNTPNTVAWLVKDSSDGPVAPGTAAAFSSLAGGEYVSAGITLTTGQQAALQVDSVGNLKVNLAAGSLGSIDESAFTAGTSVFQPNGGVFNDSLAAITTGQQAEVRITSFRAQHMNLRTSAGVELGNSIANSVFTTPSDGTTQIYIAPSSTALAAAHPALAVALSPNSPLPAGANALGSVLANIQVGSAPVTVLNPVPVTITSASSGTPIQQYLTSVSLAAGSSITLTYTVPVGHTFSLERVWASASGKIKAVVQNGATNMFAGFNSTANPNIDFTVTAPPTIAASGTVNVIITNEDKAPFDVYATVEGNQVS